MTFSPTDAAFEGFRVTRRAPVAVLIWIGLYVAFSLGTLFLLGGNLSEFMANAQSLEGNTEPSMEEMSAFFGNFFGFLLLAMPLGILMQSILYCAMTRAVVRPEQRGFGYLQVGRDEMNVVIALIALVVLFFIGMIVMSVLLGLTGVGLGLVAGEQGGAVVALLLMLALVVLGVYVALRFAFVVPMTVDHRAIRIFESWKATRGQVLKLFLTALIAIVMSIVVWILVYMVGLPVMFFAGGGFEALAAVNDPESFNLTTLPPQLLALMIAWLVLSAVISVLTSVIMYTPFVRAYVDLKGASVASGVAPAP
ncbi:MAG: hypothetical protein ACK4E3_02380 [Brevundimonas sp.]|jgi:hypothetical protein|uniref:hypothetical protein n=1 Tax=Brevundimonas sp. TaxID=1871086 RepID=UPI00391A1E3A